jgi:hypothetical protein
LNFQWLAGVDVFWAVVATSAMYLALAIYAVSRPLGLILRGVSHASRWRDLRLWIIPLVLLQVLLYWLFR